jgi:hypothetical protein
VAVDAAVIDDLRARVRAARLPEAAPGQRGCPGVEDQRAGAVGVEELACDHRVGGVSGDGGEGAAELGV